MSSEEKQGPSTIQEDTKEKIHDFESSHSYEADNDTFLSSVEDDIARLKLELAKVKNETLTERSRARQLAREKDQMSEQLSQSLEDSQKDMAKLEELTDEVHKLRANHDTLDERQSELDVLIKDASSYRDRLQKSLEGEAEKSTVAWVLTLKHSITRDLSKETNNDSSKK
mmetsp:Transcript_3924/g.5961  ORF Transcript_3924/g.5961 Transcript_3924/m.5961 type:complete len:170 (+) Transcript_3924:76-585(+)